MPRLRSFACQLWFILRHWLTKSQTPVPAHFPVQAMAAVFHPVYPLVPLQSVPVQYRGLYQIATYYGKLGAVEPVYKETISYVDGI